MRPQQWLDAFRPELQAAFFCGSNRMLPSGPVALEQQPPESKAQFETIRRFYWVKYGHWQRLPAPVRRVDLDTVWVHVETRYGIRWHTQAQIDQWQLEHAATHPQEARHALAA